MYKIIIIINYYYIIIIRYVMKLTVTIIIIMKLQERINTILIKLLQYSILFYLKIKNKIVI